MGYKLYLADRMSASLAQDVVRLEYDDRRAAAGGKPVLEMKALGTRRSLHRLLRLRTDAGQKFGNLAGWVAVAGDIAAGLKDQPRERDVEAVCVAIGIPIDAKLIATVARRVAAARRSEGEGFQMMSPEVIGKHVELTARERNELGIINIGSIDESPSERSKRLGRELKAENRRGQGVKPRPRRSVEQPWKLMSISKATYYRRGLHKTPEAVRLNFRTSIYIEKPEVQSQNPGKPEVQSHILPELQSHGTGIPENRKFSLKTVKTGGNDDA